MDLNFINHDPKGPNLLRVGREGVARTCAPLSIMARFRFVESMRA